MTDPIIKKAVALKKEIADVKSAELDRHMSEIMTLILGATQNAAGDKPKKRE